MVLLNGAELMMRWKEGQLNVAFGLPGVNGALACRSYVLMMGPPTSAYDDSESRHFAAGLTPPLIITSVRLGNDCARHPF
jgi:hypothetical protein